MQAKFGLYDEDGNRVWEADGESPFSFSFVAWPSLHPLLDYLALRHSRRGEGKRRVFEACVLTGVALRSA